MDLYLSNCIKAAEAAASKAASSSLKSDKDACSTKIIESQVNKLNEERRACDDAAAAEFQQWLLQEGKKPFPNEDQLIKLRHLRMINKELDKLENTSERRNTLQLKEEDRQHWDNVRTKLNLRKQVEEEWQAKEMTLLIKIGEEVKREGKIEEHRRKIREEINRKIGTQVYFFIFIVNVYISR
ncbi:Fibrous sheath-interacting protein 2 [Cricetulus griseus]|uniref:Fibrous sheath-interacting protein 2 n=1 Tax=Cricetulus griseus TaxID=10029 RepID=G3IBH8_CRIGR|nr:Fibrous sheath-interacting protein 2 [Cricetulus griseus]